MLDKNFTTKFSKYESHPSSKKGICITLKINVVVILIL